MSTFAYKLRANYAKAKHMQLQGHHTNTAHVSDYSTRNLPNHRADSIKTFLFIWRKDTNDPRNIIQIKMTFSPIKLDNDGQTTGPINKTESET